MPNYDASSHDPPAPVARVILRDLAATISIPDIPLIIDTGADVTLLPRTAVKSLGVKPVNGMEYELIGFDGNRSIAQAVELDMIFLQKAFRGKYLLIDSDRGVLGRDVLASVVIILDGPRREWSEQRNAKLDLKTQILGMADHESTPVTILPTRQGYHPFFYWAVVVATTTAGTTMSDFLDRTAGLGYVYSSIIEFGCVLAVLFIWHRTTGRHADRISRYGNILASKALAYT